MAGRQILKTSAVASFSTLAVAAILAFPAATPAIADAGWSNGAPIFSSDLKQQREAAERRREQLRAKHPASYPKFMDGGDKPDVDPTAPPIIQLTKAEAAGTVIIDTQARRLYYTLEGNRAYVYPISVGREGFTWTGTERISRKVEWPSWTPPASMHRRQPGLPITVSGGILNPLGAKALYLGSTIYRIHGTNNPRSIGQAASSGCFRMMNRHVVHLASVTRIGTRVKVVRAYSEVADVPPLKELLAY